MTRKHYRRMAQQLGQHLKRLLKDETEFGIAEVSQFYKVIDIVCDNLKFENRRFKADKFLDAIEVEARS